MKKQKSVPTVRTIAKKVGMSVASVSRALTGSPLVTEKTRQAVLKVAEEVNYKPNPLFRQMAIKSGNKPKFNNLGIILQSLSQAELITNPYYGRLFWSIEKEVRERGGHLIVNVIDQGKDSYLPEIIKDMRIDGAFIVSQFDVRLLERISGSVPAVLVNCPPMARCNASVILPDENTAVIKMIDYLRKNGHEKIFFYDIHDTKNYHHLIRHQSFLFASRDIPHVKAFILKSRDKSLEETVMDQLLQWQKDDNLPAALFCAADVYAAAFLQAAEKLGISVPHDMSVVGMDDLFFCEYCRPKLTSMRAPLEEMGRTAVSRLIESINQPSLPKSVQLFDVELIERESCRNLDRL